MENGAGQPLPYTITNLIITEDGFAVAYEDDAAAEAAVRGWGTWTNWSYGQIGGLIYSATSGAAPSSKTFNDADLTVFADEDAWHHLRYEFTAPGKVSLLVDGKKKR